MLLTKTGIRCAGALGMLLVAAGAAHAGALAPRTASTDSRMSTAQGQRLLASRSAHFIENKGQWNSQARYLARSESLDLWFTDQGVEYDHHRRVGGAKLAARHQPVNMTFLGGNRVKPVAQGLTGATVDFLKPGATAKGVRTYSELLAKGVYPGIDVRDYFDDARPRYDMIVSPGANANQIKMRFKGNDGLAVVKGQLHVATSLGYFSNGNPLAYQTVGNHRVLIPAKWTLLDQHTAGFKLGAYDHTKRLVIDPLVYGSYVGGNGGADEVHAVSAAADGAVFITGVTYSSVFSPINSGSFGLTYNGNGDAFLARLSGDAYTHDYSAYIGSDGYDAGYFLKRDASGNVWIAGETNSFKFPGAPFRPYYEVLSCPGQSPQDVPNGGTFRLSVSGKTTAEIFWNASASEIQTAIRNLDPNFTDPNQQSNGLENVTVTVIRSLDGTDRLPFARFKLEGASGFTVNNKYTVQDINNVPTVTNEGLPPSYHLVPPTEPGPFPPADPNDNSAPRANPQRIHRYGSTPTAGTFTIKFVSTPTSGNPVTSTTPAIPYNAPANGTNPPSIASILATTSALTVTGTGGTLDQGRNADALNPNVSHSQFDVRVSFATTATPPVDAPQKPLGLADVNNANLIRSSKPFGHADPVGYQIDTTLDSYTDYFVMEFLVGSDGTVTAPDPNATTSTMLFGSDGVTRLGNFDILQQSGSTVNFMLSGSTQKPLRDTTATPTVPNYPSYGNGFVQIGYVVRYAFSGGTYTRLDDYASPSQGTFDPVSALPYVTSADGFPVDVRGAIFDSSGNIYYAGTLYFNSNADLKTSKDVFYAGNPGSSGLFNTPEDGGGFHSNGYDARLSDIFVRKMAFDGTTVFSGLLGGVENDEAGGFGAGLDGSFVNTGSPIAIDSNRNVYVTGVSRSFDFERTHGVFDDAPADGDSDTTVTKISADGKDIVYSTYLGGVSNEEPAPPVPFGEIFANMASSIPAGISVDARGYAYITGNLRPYYIQFPQVPPTNPVEPDPVEPVTNYYTNAGNATAPVIYIPTNPDDPALDATYTGPAAPALGTTEGYLTVLNDTATNIVYATYVGGDLDDFVFAPYVSSTNDIWIGGWTDSKRYYDRPKLTGQPVQYRETAGNPVGAFISSRAFKASSDTEGGASFNVDRVGYGIWSYYTYTRPVYTGPDYIPMAFSRDGFVAKLRIQLASVSRFTLSPSSVPGGLGAFTTGTVTLSQGAPSGGGTIQVDIINPNGAASLSATNPSVSSIQVPVAAGATSVQFPVYTNGVTQQTPVTVKATFSGTFAQQSFQVVPWLQGLTLSGSSTIGGDTTTPLKGTVTLSAPALAGGVDVVITTDNPAATVAGGSVNVPQGQTSAPFTIDTTGVNTAVVVHVKAMLLGVSFTQSFTLNPSGLLSVGLSPNPVVVGTSSNATVTLDGVAGSNFKFTLESDNPAVAQVSAANADTPNSNPLTFTIPAGQSSLSGIEITTTGAGTAHIIAKHTDGNNVVTTRQATLTVQALNISSFTLTPSTVASGATTTGRVTLATNAPDGGARIFVSTSDSSRVTFSGLTRLAGSNPARFYLLIPAGSKEATFTAQAGYVGVVRTPTITAGGVTKTLTINPITWTVTFPNPASVTGSSGQTKAITGTVTITSPVPPNATATPITFTLDSNNHTAVPQSAINPTTVTISSTASTRTATFTVKPKNVDSPTPVKITATYDTGVSTGNLTVNPVGLASIRITPLIVHGGGSFKVYVTFTGPQTDVTSSETLSITSDNTSAVPNRGNIAVKAASPQTADPTDPYVIPLTFTANRVSRATNVTITATYNHTTVQAVVTIQP